MPNSSNRSHLSGINRRDVLLVALSLAVPPGSSQATDATIEPKVADEYVPENNYPTFADESYGGHENLTGAS